jgi:hypothetical protein
MVSESSRLQWLPHFSRDLVQDSDSDFQTVARLTRVITQSGGAICPPSQSIAEWSVSRWLSAAIYSGLFSTRRLRVRLSQLTYNSNAH